MELLRREGSVRERWDEEEMWGVVASIVVTASEPRAAASADKQAAWVSDAVRRLRSVGTTMVLVPVANVSPPEVPLVLADCVIGQLDDAFWSVLDATAQKWPMAAAHEKGRLADLYQSVPSGLVLAATWSRGQGALAVAHGERRLRAILDLSLALEPSPEDLGLFSLRGGTNRPGIRGLTVHRPALAQALDESELAAEIVVVNRRGAMEHVQFHGAEPLPLSALLGESLGARWLIGAYSGRHPSPDGFASPPAGMQKRIGQSMTTTRC